MNKTQKGSIHAVAYCQDCNWEETNYMVTQKETRKHAFKTGHTVIIETGYAQTYNPKREIV